MAAHCILLIEHPARLKINLGRLCIEQNERPSRFVLPKDIDVLCLHNPAISLSTAVLHTLAKNGAIVLVTDERHEPCAMLYPLKAHVQQGLRLQLQIAFAKTESASVLWQQIIQARIRSQAMNLRAHQRKGALYLERMATKVPPGDIHNHEGQASKHYWKHLFNGSYRRIKQGATDGINARLNYGYAVLRAMLARQIAMNGLNAALGIGHHSSENPFNLADDFIEPYRFLVEQQTVETTEKHPVPPPFNSIEKKRLLIFATRSVAMKDGDYRLTTAIEKTVNSYCQILNGDGMRLALPVF